MADLINYHGNSKVIGRICELLNSMTGVSFRKVQTLPQTGESNVIYLVPKSTSETDNVFDEYIWIDNDWELIGTTEIDLSNYYTKTETDDLLDDKADIGDIPTVNDGVLTLQKDGTNVDTFTANASANKTINIDNTDKVNWVSNGILGAKNLVPFPYNVKSGTVVAQVTFTTDSKGVVDINGTATGGNAQFIICTNLNGILEEGKKYILNGCVGGASNTYKLFIDKYNGSYSNVCNQYDGEDVEFTMPTGYSAVRLGVAVYSGKSVSHQAIKPMIRLASDTDTTYQPYSKTNYELTKDKYEIATANIVGAKNFNSYPYYYDSRTINNVVWTVNSDGTLNANGQASANSNFICHSRNNAKNKLILKNGRYIVSGCPSGASSSTFEIVIERTKNGSAQTICTCYEGEEEFVLNGDDYSDDEVQVQLICRVRQNYNAQNIVFKPMIRSATDTDSTYQPYAMTNRELTEVVNEVPTNSGTYTLQATVDASGNVTYSWV